MKKKLIPHFAALAFFCLMLTSAASAQRQELEGVIGQIEFKEDTIKSIFEWITKEIAYDSRRALLKSKTKTWSLSEKDYVREVIVTRRGLCFHYALLFNAILKHMGYESYVVQGYVITYGQVKDDEAHAWNAVRVGRQWLMFDPTWAAGYVDRRTAEFVRCYDPQWYAQKPDDFIRTHVPFDPLWQLKSAPLTHTQIKAGNFVQNESASFDFNDSLLIYKKQNELDRVRSAFTRIKSSGVTNSLLEYELDLMEAYIRNLQNEKLIDTGFDQMRQASRYFNNYVTGKNRRFKNPDWSDNDLKSVPDSVSSKVISALRAIALVQSPSPAMVADMDILKKKADEISGLIKTESTFINRYLKTKKPLRFLVLDKF